ncbi:hypothetical protein [Mesorhizobium sp.]|uniref:hypothetical protein n=1 Tax=Mesorhizobium sp. TaxID=1871066 RepID=UPI0025C56BA9|nr:hypothetical protein [Mesorhizobium sp.]
MRSTSAFFPVVVFFYGAGDLVAKRGASAESAAGQPYSSFGGLRRPLSRAPDLDKVFVALLGLFGYAHLLGNLPVEDRQVLGKPIEFAHMPLDREPLIVGH